MSSATSLYLCKGKIFHPGVCSGLAVGEDPKAWSEYRHAPGPDGKNKSSCANGSYLDGTCDSGKSRTLSLYANSSLNGQPGGDARTGTPDSEVAQFAIDKLHQLGNTSEPFFLAVGLHKCVSNLPLMLTIEVFM